MAAVADLRVQITESIVGAGVIQAAVSGISDAFGKAIDIGVSYNSMLEKTEGAYKQLFGSADAAQSKIKEFQQFAAATPFELPGVLAMGRSLAVAGVEADNLIPTMQALGATIASTGEFSQEQVQGVTTAVTQMLAKGKVSAEEINQLADRGIFGWDLLATHFKMSTADIMKAAEKGKISGKDFIDAMNEAAEAKGWKSLLGDMSKTWEGAMSTITDNAQIAIAQGFKPLFEEGRDALVGLAGYMSSTDFQGFAAGAGAAMQALVNIIKGEVVPTFAGLQAAISASADRGDVSGSAQFFDASIRLTIASILDGIAVLRDFAQAATVAFRIAGDSARTFAEVAKAAIIDRDWKKAQDIQRAGLQQLGKDFSDLGSAASDAFKHYISNAQTLFGVNDKATKDVETVADAFKRASDAARASADSAAAAAPQYVAMGTGMKQAADAAKKVKEEMAPKGGARSGGVAGTARDLGAAADAAADLRVEYGRLLDEYVRGNRVGGLMQAEMQDRLRQMQDILDKGGAGPTDIVASELARWRAAGRPDLDTFWNNYASMSDAQIGQFLDAAHRESGMGGLPAPSAAGGVGGATTAAGGIVYSFNAPVTFSEGPASGESWVAYMERMMVPIRAAASAQQAGRR